MPKYSIFSVLGLEIEYMLVDKQTLNIRPCSDQLLQKMHARLSGTQTQPDQAATIVNEVNLAHGMAISNELVLHVIELKNNPPIPPSAQLIDAFQQTIVNLQPDLDAAQLCLLPTASHPWMNPKTETKRWTHDNYQIYEALDNIFNCQGHGWANLQSMHVNLPFANDEEFSQLHNGIRLLLPLLPAIAASSPFHAGKATRFLDTRLDYYNRNQAKIPQIAGDIIPEFVCSQTAYEKNILSPMYAAIRPFDPQGHLQHEWLNSRAAIPKFQYGAIEIRLLDAQECVRADMAIAFAIFYILRSLHRQHSDYLQNPCDTKRLKALYLSTLKQGLHAGFDDPILRQQLQLPATVRDCRSAWTALLEKHAGDLDHGSQQILEAILKQGNLSDRLLRAAGPNPSHARLKDIYQTLAQCLLTNTPYHPS